MADENEEMNDADAQIDEFEMPENVDNDADTQIDEFEMPANEDLEDEDEGMTDTEDIDFEEDDLQLQRQNNVRGGRRKYSKKRKHSKKQKTHKKRHNKTRKIKRKRTRSSHKRTRARSRNRK
jgi:hypothetical protein